MSSFTNREKLLTFLLVLAIPFAGIGISRSTLFHTHDNLSTSAQESGSTSSDSPKSDGAKSDSSSSSSGTSKSGSTTGSKSSNPKETSSSGTSKKSTSSSKVIKTGKYGYKGYKDSTDTTIKPILKGWDNTGLVTGEGFTLPDVASASNILNLFQKDFPDCKTIPNPNADSPIALSGSVGADTLSGCTQGDPTKSGFNIYFITDKQTVISNSGKDSVNLYTNFKSPYSSKLEQVYFTPSSRAIVLSTGGDYAFDANEVSWGILFDLGYTPPKR